MSYIKLNKQNLFYNLETCANHAGGKEKIAIVLKDNAYGHGLLQIATLANEFGLRKAVVQTYKEAITIEHLFDTILILADTKIDTFSHTFHVAVNSLNDLELLCENTNIHIKIDTGMHRNGIAHNELEVAILRALERKLNVCGIFTHHKSADELSSDFFYQDTIFKGLKEEMKNICEKLNVPKILVHSCNSAALFRHKNFDEDFARVGIASYGYLDANEVLGFPKLKPVLSLYAKKIATRILKKGQSVGYGGTYTATEDIEVSTYSVGYGDGFRRLGGKAYETADGKQVLGRVSMDNIVVEGSADEICIFDDVTRLAEIHNTITYEILTGQNANISREIV
ncbi:MAG: alanine racemase [Arcobacteraceae bacterium]|jgi:alanine racemase|nr:alanine racemase [Arcobacteraceae bacterium]